MNSELTVAILAGLGGMLGWGLADFFAKKTIDQIGDILTLAWGHIFGSLVLVIIAIYQISHKTFHLPDTSDARTWIILVVFGVLQAAVYLFLYKGFGKGQVTLLGPVFATFSGITAILSIVVFGERLTSSLLGVLVLIFAGVLMISLDWNTLKSRKLSFSHIPGLSEVIVATLMASVWTLMWDRFLGGRDWLPYTMMMYFFMTIATIMYLMAKKVKISGIPTHLWKFLFFIGAGEMLAYLAVSLGYSTTSFTSITVLLSGAFSLPTIILAYFFLKERVSKTQFAGCLVVVSGLALLSLV